METFSTSALPRASRRAALSDLLSSKFATRFEVEPNGHDLVAKVSGYTAGALTLGCTRSSPLTVRGFGRAPGSSADGFLLHLQCQGVSVGSQGGREALLQRGDLTIADVRRPFCLHTEVTTHAIVLSLPADRLTGLVPEIDELTALTIPGDRGAGAMLGSFVRSLWAQTLKMDEIDEIDEEWHEGMRAVVVDLTASAFRRLEPPAPTSSQSLYWRRQIRRYVDRHICDPDFKVSAISSALGITPRHVQRVFAEATSTPSAYILERRLQMAAERLRRGPGEASVTTVAFDAGFNDLTYFGRVFRRKFGVTPREYRSGQRVTAADRTRPNTAWPLEADAMSG